jgi:hypothetical protein
MVRWLAVALVLLAGCAYADVAEPLVEPLSLLQDAPAGSKQDPGEQAAASVEAEAKKVEEEAAEMEKSDVAKDDSKASDAGAEVFIKADKPAAPAPAPPAKAEATPPAAADSIAETPKEANAVKAIVDAPSKASEQMNDEKQQTEYEVKLEKAMPTHPEQTQAAGGEAAQPEAQAAEDNSATAKYAHILNPAKQPTASEMQGYKRLKTKLDQRKRERMQRDNDQAQRKQMRAHAESRIADAKLAAAQKELAALHTKMVNLTAEKDAAHQAVGALEMKIHALHNKASEDEKMLVSAKHTEEEAKGMRAATEIQEAMQAAEANTGGDTEDLKHAQQRREFNNEQLAASVNASAAATEDANKKQDAVAAVEEKVHTVEMERHLLNDQLQQQDHKVAGLQYDIQDMQSDLRKAEEKVAQTEAIAQIAKQRFEVARKEGQAAKDNLSRNKRGVEEIVSAEALDPELAQETAVKEVMDQDGLGDNGEALVAAKGEVSRQYERMWRSMPMPNPSNPLLDAVSAAAVKDPALPKDLSPN